MSIGARLRKFFETSKNPARMGGIFAWPALRALSGLPFTRYSWHLCSGTLRGEYFLLYFRCSGDPEINSG